jgi:hypothetical protein
MFGLCFIGSFELWTWSRFCTRQLGMLDALLHDSATHFYNNLKKLTGISLRYAQKPFLTGTFFRVQPHNGLSTMYVDNGQRTGHKTLHKVTQLHITSICQGRQRHEKCDVTRL